MKAITTYKFRVKDATSSKRLNKMAAAVNFVWNYCNETSHDCIRNRGKWLSGYDLNKLTSGCSKELGILADTINCVGQEYAIRRRKAQKTKLAWRSAKRSLGWIPLKATTFKLIGDRIIYGGKEFRFWKSREIQGELRTATFSQDARRRWYINIQCEIEVGPQAIPDSKIGIDLGVKTIATISNGLKYDRENHTRKYEHRLAMAQRAKKYRLINTIQAKIKNSRKDWAHKTTTNIIKSNGAIIVGDVSPSKLKKTPMAKSVSDAGWYQFKSLLAYKAIRLGREYREVKENFSTVTCSSCLNRTGPSGLSALGVREWACSICGTVHDRDVNAAKNILRLGLQSPKGIPAVIEGGSRVTKEGYLSNPAAGQEEKK